ncbi:hypothetical protein [Bradyrhizobium genosp. A]|uniref:hypothetical protein n=1 Tax=Bradyrhizobium genosp. A TaxID=83626 RepID=UPI003CEDBF17
MSRLDRLREYANPSRRENWDGESNDKANLDRWSKRASENSKLAPRAKGGEIKLPDTGSDVSLHDTEAKPRGGDARAVAKADKNVVGDSSYLAGIRRNA